MDKYKRIPITTAKRIANQYQKDQVIIITQDRIHDTEHVITYGKSKLDCILAARLGNYIKREVLGWPLDICNAKPTRAKKDDQFEEEG